MSALEWAGENLSLGGILKNAGGAAGSIVRIGAEGAGYAASLITENHSAREGIVNAGRLGDEAITTTSKVIGDGVNWVVVGAGDMVGMGVGYVAKASGASEKNIAIAETIGKLAGSLIVATAAGGVLAHAAVIAAAAPGLAGAAAATNGLAALGGGAITAGGGGMAAGAAITNVIVAAAGASGLASRLDND
jgi:hypothetical protein